MKEAMISELKARLSSFLAAVRRGETVVVRDRQTPIARIVPYRESGEGFRVRGASLPPEELGKIRPVKLHGGVDPLQLLREDREQR